MIPGSPPWTARCPTARRTARPRRRRGRPDTVLDPAVIGTLVGEFVRYGVVPRAGAGGPGTGWDAGFTARERDVVEHVTTGAGNAEIAGTLGLSETTVKSHVSSALTGLRLRDRVQPVVRAYRNGAVRPPSPGEGRGPTSCPEPSGRGTGPRHGRGAIGLC
jgi:DNA-binding NarL/FixJ family response regulator